jgi:hypothetical protein
MNSSKTMYGSNLFSSVFFSKDNVENLQNLIRFAVFKQTNEIIDKQSENELLIIMRSIFLTYPNFPPEFKKGMSLEQINYIKSEYQKEVNRLNEIIVNETVPDIVSQIKQYKDYLRDSSRVSYIETPSDTSIKGQRQYRSITEVLTGYD